jgi:hypothetical protein
MDTSDILPAIPGSYAVWLDGSTIWNRYKAGEHFDHYRHHDIIRATVPILGWEHRKWRGSTTSCWPILAAADAPDFDVENGGDTVLIVQPDKSVFSVCQYFNDGEERHLIDAERFSDLTHALNHYRWRWFHHAQKHKAETERRQEEEWKRRAAQTDQVFDTGLSGMEPEGQA